jgi:hypothetical protein
MPFFVILDDDWIGYEGKLMCRAQMKIKLKQYYGERFGVVSDDNSGNFMYAVFHFAVVYFGEFRLHKRVSFFIVL